MKKIFNLKYFAIFSIFIAFLYLFTNLNPLMAQNGNQELEGWAWSDSIGWISLNCSNMGDCGKSNYKVILQTNGTLTGYAWSDNIGWIKFDPSINDAPSGPGTDLNTAYLDRDKVAEELDPYTGNPTGEEGLVFKGWARACAVFEKDQNGKTKCSGTLRSNFERGNWDGWISMSGGAVVANNNLQEAGEYQLSGLQIAQVSGEESSSENSESNTSINQIAFDIEEATSFDGDYAVVLKADESLGGFAWGGDVLGWISFANAKLKDPFGISASCIDNEPELVVGNPINFEVVASGAGDEYDYEWYKGSLPSVDNLLDGVDEDNYTHTLNSNDVTGGSVSYLVKIISKQDQNKTATAICTYSPQTAPIVNVIEPEIETFGIQPFTWVSDEKPCVARIYAKNVSSCAIEKNGNLQQDLTYINNGSFVIEKNQNLDPGQYRLYCLSSDGITGKFSNGFENCNSTGKTIEF